jgi:CRISPR-associated protein Csx17
MPTIALNGCSPIPLARYLKALGVLKVVANQSERSVRCRWSNRVFYIETGFSESGLTSFFLERYVPTAIVVPWSGSDFFGVDRNAKRATFPKPPTSSRVIEAFLNSTSPRLKEYRDTIQAVFRAMDCSGVCAKKSIEGSGSPQRKLKADFIRTLRSMLPEPVVEWIDCAAVIEQEAPYFNAVLGGGGGSDGNSHFSDNYMQSLWMALPDFETQRKRPITAVGGVLFDSRQALNESLFEHQSSGTRIAGLSPVLFDATRVGGPNQTTGFQAKASSNPWDFILMLEGSSLFSGALGRKLDASSEPSARFPFLFEASPVGLGASFLGESAGRELWLPIWSKLAGLEEIRAILSEGRIEKHGRMARRGTDVFVATAQFGFDRGISEFQRIGFFKGRIGGDNYFTAVDQGYITPNRNEAIDLLRDFDAQMDQLISAAKADRCPTSIRRRAVELDTAIAALAVATESRGERLQTVLIALGRLERALSRSLAWSQERIRPIQGLRLEWLAQTNDGSREFRLARSVAGMRARLGDETLWIRQHLEPLANNATKERLWVKWDQRSSNDVVWHEGDLSKVLIEIVMRRRIRFEQAGANGWPDWSPFKARLDDIAAFIEGRTDGALLADLIWGLSLLDWEKCYADKAKEFEQAEAGHHWTQVAEDEEKEVIPSASYALVRLCFRPTSENGDAIPLVPAILQRAMNGDGKGASELAARRLYGSGKAPLVKELPVSGDIARRTAAAILFPISHRDFHLLEHMILKQQNQQNT